MEYRLARHEDAKLRLRPYKACDAKTIAGWIKDEISLRKWSSDRFGAFPVTEADINHKYMDCNGDCMDEDNFGYSSKIVGEHIHRFLSGSVVA